MTALLRPRDGVPNVSHTPAAFQADADRIRAGRGPIAIDTERASDYRFDDRAFLVQLRRVDSGTALIAPEPDRAACTAALAPVLNDAEWVLHAAPSDLPALALLGLRPSRIFDTELAGRLLGFPKVNLAALTGAVLGLELAKEHSNENWSTWPLPESWRNYAALDVEILLELAEALTELLDDAGKLSWLEEECAYLVQHIRQPRPQWTDLKGIGKLKKPQQLLIAKALWERRQTVAQSKDKAPHKVLANNKLVDIAYAAPTSSKELRRILGSRTSASQLTRMYQVIAEASSLPRSAWPTLEKKDYNVVPAPRSLWSSQFPEAQEALQAARAELSELGEETHTPAENLLQPSVLRHLVWDVKITRKITTSAQLLDRMRELEVRSWQQELTAPLLSRALL